MSSQNYLPDQNCRPLTQGKLLDLTISLHGSSCCWHLNCSYWERRLPGPWKMAALTPLLRSPSITDIKHLQPISVTPILSKIAAEYVMKGYVKPAFMKKVDFNQYGTLSNSFTVHALMRMLHAWYKDSDGNGSTVRVVLFNFRKAHWIF